MYTPPLSGVWTSCLWRTRSGRLWRRSGSDRCSAVCDEILPDCAISTVNVTFPKHAVTCINFITNGFSFYFLFFKCSYSCNTMLNSRFFIFISKSCVASMPLISRFLLFLFALIVLYHLQIVSL